MKGFFMVLLICMALVVLLIVQSNQSAMQLPTPTNLHGTSAWQFTKTPTVTVEVTVAPILSTPLPHLVTVNVPNLHLRACPGTSCKVLNWLQEGMELEHNYECMNGWLHVTMDDGWVYSSYVSENVCEDK